MLEDLIDELRQAVEAQDLWAIVASNRAFHETIASASRNAFLTRQLTALQRMIERTGQTTLADEDRHQETLAEHAAILAAIAAQDPNTAEQATRDHFEKALCAAASSRPTRASAPPSTPSGAARPSSAVEGGRAPAGARGPSQCPGRRRWPGARRQGARAGRQQQRGAARTGPWRPRTIDDDSVQDARRVIEVALSAVPERAAPDAPRVASPSPAASP